MRDLFRKHIGLAVQVRGPVGREEGKAQAGGSNLDARL